jgi:hypothetical protein
VSQQKTPSCRVFRMSVVAALLLLQGLPAAAAELRDIVVEKNDDRYHLSSTTYFDATQSQLYNLLIDYDKFVLFSSAFAEAENRAPDEQGRPQFYTKMEGCVLLFCRTYIRIGYLELEPEHDIVAIVDPEQSNFNYSRERWQLIPDGEGTILIYHFEMEPGFWVPPIIGPYVIKRALLSAGKRAVNRIEAVALGKTPEK